MTDWAAGLRIGQGIDVHRFSDDPNRPLVLGGVAINEPGVRGLDGHSDADVVAHAIADAVLGAAGLG
ncbi:MAG TPA: 2-C-methyl-D-erythritol 2,4-cyclodiphosphate synthase, partial [Acidimicrobiales bacterium]|nr:2-C-methyl-D-erythritol 2,4-cyclodiphosphate synthase [Acidimicrobiales bacterium]